MGKILAIFSAIGALFGTIFYAFSAGKNKGKIETISEENNATLDEIKEAKEIEENTNNMSSSDIDKWLYGHARDKE